ncbi:DNA replication/repair protein RecF [Aquiluna sp. KACHI24]|uniref:DNA replication/repair protein RecF n=1 Tax=Aquiluna sp. KACHI24 TaxID=2968831 RepID=UPI00220030B4|nr:DNA replication/repair protein RecF [Aquiluna sp. KACHI24]BDP99666.1 DNA replication and repair protein RecF [Aquiluna sp. KACHI24]
MWVRSLKLESFRNYANLDVGFSEGMNLLFGDNGNGKTNLAEAIYFLSELQSHRNSDNKTLLQTGHSKAVVVAEVQNQERTLLLGAEINIGTSNKYFINGNQQKRTSEFLGLIKTVIFAPEDLDLIRRDRADRRRFLDQSTSQLKPRLALVKSDYDRVLKQRNALLKSAKGQQNIDLTTLDIWDQQLVKLGTQISLARLELLELIAPLLQRFYAALSGSSEAIELQLELNIGNDESGEVLTSANAAELEQMFHEKLKAVRNKEIERGLTLVGPHRDELLISKSGLPTRTHSSQGEAWSLALGLKLAMAELLRQDTLTGDPILILDDVFAVLDSGRRNRLLEFVSDYEQVIITSADRASTPEIDWAREFEVVRGGQIAQL